MDIRMKGQEKRGVIHIRGNCPVCDNRIKQEFRDNVLFEFCTSCTYIQKRYLGKPKYIFPMFTDVIQKYGKGGWLTTNT